MSVTVVNSWPATFTTSSGFTFSQPFGAHEQVAIANSDGNWLVALAAWQSPGEFATTMSFGDDAGNHWQPLGSPVGTSSAAGEVRSAIWAAPYAAVASTVWASPSGYSPAYAVLVLELAGMGPGMSLQAIGTALANAATSAGISLPAPAVQVITLACAGSDNNANAVTMSGPGWTALTTVAASNGTDHTADLTLTSGWQVTSGAVSATWTAAAALNLGACGCMLAVTQAAPAGPSQGWPLIQFQAAFGAGITTPWDQLQWTDLTSRYRGISGGRGRQYELDSVQASSMSLALSNNDGALTPGNASSPYNLGISGWTAGNNATIALSRAYARTGPASMLMAPDGVTAFPYASTAQVPVTTGASYSAQAAALCPAGWATGVLLSLDWFDASRTYLSTSNGTLAVAIAGQWAYPSIAATAPASAAYARLDVKVQGTPPAGTLFWWDACYLLSPAGAVMNANPVFAAGPDVFTPVRLLATWQGRQYPAWRGFMERWPQALSGARYTQVPGIATDIYAGMTALLPTAGMGEVLNDEPWGYWPGTDAAGSTMAANLAPTGAPALNVVTSKYGPGPSGTQAFGGTAPFTGAATGCWVQSGLNSGSTDIQHGYCLQLQVTPSAPPISQGLTIEAWHDWTGVQPNGKLIAWSLQGPYGPIAQLYGDYDGSGSGIGWYLAVTDKDTRAVTSYRVFAFGIETATWPLFAVTLTQSAWTVTINGGQFAPSIASGTCNLASTWQWITFGGSADRVSTGGSSNISLAGLAVYPRVLPAPRILAHWSAVTVAMGGDGEGSRMTRLMSYPGMLVPRRLGLGPDNIGPATDISGQPCAQAVTNIAQSGAGLLYADRCGYLAYQSRDLRWNKPAAWNVGENAAAILNSNWDFETGISPWTPASLATVASSSAASFTGQQSMLVTPQSGASGAAGEQVAVTAGATYTATAWLNSPGGYATGGHAQIQWFSSPSTLLSTTTGTTVPLSAGQWALVTASAVAPGGAVLARLVVSLAGSPTSANIYYADLAQLTLPGEVPYLGDIAFDFDPSQVYDDLTISQSGGVTVTASSATSIAQYGDLTLQETVYLSNPDLVQDLADRILADYGQPSIRVAAFTVDAAANPAAWAFALSTDVGTVVQVTRRLGGTFPVISLPFVIQSVSPSNAPGQYQVRYTATPYYLGALATNDPVRGLPNGSNEIAF